MFALSKRLKLKKKKKLENILTPTYYKKREGVMSISFLILLGDKSIFLNWVIDDRFVK